MFEIRSNSAAFLRQLNRVRAQQHADIRYALNGTVFDISQKTLPRAMRQRFANPTRFTQKAFKYEKARASGSGYRASVVYKYNDRSPLPRHYLETQVEGGKRTEKAFERRVIALAKAMDYSFPSFLVPSRFVRKDKHGNVTRGVYNQVMADLKVMSVASSNRSDTRRSKAKQKKRRIFIGSPAINNLDYGIWAREGRRIYPLFHGVSDPGTYSQRLDLHRIEVREDRLYFPRHLHRAMAKTARKAGFRLL